MNDPKIIAFFLPQFYENEDNNIWWGKGFTEWTCIKEALINGKAKGEVITPQCNNYYNLLDTETMQWQTELSKEYGIYGFAYYHYWMEGKTLLNEPAEKLLANKEINQRFFMFWANHSWYKANGNKKSLLIQQTYGGEEDWEKHYNYLSLFFSDDRYIKVEDKPIIGIFNADDISRYDEMMSYFDKRAKLDGFDGVFFIESVNKIKKLNNRQKSNLSLLRQPDLSKNIYEIRRPIRSAFYKLLKKTGFSKVKKIDYRKISRYELQIMNKYNDHTYIYCVSTGWNNTPRHGDNGQFFENYSIEIFKEELNKIYITSKKQGKEFIFINAWNEWAEGMVLEPDDIYGLNRLKAVKEVINLND